MGLLWIPWFFFCAKMSSKKKHIWYSTVCPISSDPFYVVTYFIKWVTTSWTYSMYTWIDNVPFQDPEPVPSWSGSGPNSLPCPLYSWKCDLRILILILADFLWPLIFILRRSELWNLLTAVSVSVHCANSTPKVTYHFMSHPEILTGMP